MNEQQENEIIKLKARIEQLEIKISFQEANIEELNTVITKQHKDIEKVTIQLLFLLDKYKSLAPFAIASSSEETPPPHY